MICGWEKRDDYWTNISSPDFGRDLKYRGYLETPKHELSDLRGFKKNGMRMLWHSYIADITTRKCERTRDLSCGDARIYLEVEVRRVKCKRCGKVKREKLPWLANNPFYTKRFSYYVGRKCRAMTVKDVAKELKLDWHTVKALDKEYMQEQLRRNPVAAPRAIGIDEISLRKGHTYRIVVSDLERGKPIWYGGEDRSEASMDMFYEWLGPKKTKKIELAVMDMWKAFRKSTRKNAPGAAILYDKFHVMRHLGDALDKVRKMEYTRLSGKDRSYIKGQKYTLLSNRENLTLDGKKALKKLLTGKQAAQCSLSLKRVFWSVMELSDGGMGHDGSSTTGRSRLNGND